MIYHYPYTCNPQRSTFYPPYYPFPNRPINNSDISKNTRLGNSPRVDKENLTIVNSKNNSYNRNDNKSDVFFELFGIKLYFDDVLLICLIFFLYNEGIKDQYLFISLILLLLS